MTLALEDQIWNRAALEAGGTNPSEGDAALAALLLVHGMIMNGGIDHAVDALNADQLTAGIEGFRYFGLLDAASVLEKVSVDTQADFKQLDDEYGSAVPTDGRLVEAFEAKLLASPEEFASIQKAL